MRSYRVLVLFGRVAVRVDDVFGEVGDLYLLLPPLPHPLLYRRPQRRRKKGQTHQSVLQRPPFLNVRQEMLVVSTGLWVMCLLPFLLSMRLRALWFVWLLGDKK